MSESIATKCEIEGVRIFRIHHSRDSRGYFSKVFSSKEPASSEIPREFAEVNVSYSVKGVIRGLHFQIGSKAQGKFISIVAGKVVDVLVDIRHDSSTYKKWKAIKMSPEGYNAIWIPPGLAHGF
ncbi:MAG: dTDP-4-dehydrorhamnose 3,5-epimerase family protein, partial [Nitrososphaerota archaeon]|nr:dTDP-4-dehydrorhamnose 3,5-epimerase family protein [Nitrososphaerota archaeon]